MSDPHEAIRQGAGHRNVATGAQLLPDLPERVRHSAGTVPKGESINTADRIRRRGESPKALIESIARGRPRSRHCSAGRIAWFCWCRTPRRSRSTRSSLRATADPSASLSGRSPRSCACAWSSRRSRTAGGVPARDGQGLTCGAPLSPSLEADAHERTPTSGWSRRRRCWWTRQTIPAVARHRARNGLLLGSYRAPRPRRQHSSCIRCG